MLYRMLSYVAFGGLFPVWAMHPKLRDGIGRRLGSYPDAPWPPSRGDGPRIWLHGASAGDLIALSPIITEIRNIAPESTLIVSTMTNSGHRIAVDQIESTVEGVTFLPYDLPGATRRAVHAIQPDLLVLEYTEIWPNLIEAIAESSAALALTNGRFNEALIARYRWFFKLIGNPLRRLDLLLMRSEIEAERAVELGADPRRVFATGNTKFDLVETEPDAGVVESLKRSFSIRDEPIFVAGSTHEGEEAGLIRTYARLRKKVPNLRLIIAPRYVERGSRIAALAHDQNLSVALRTECTPDAPADASVSVLVLDTLGELLAAYRLARLVVVGGSFVKRGGQNILEPASQGRPVLYGPYMMNFRESVEVLQGRGGLRVADYAELEEVADSLLSLPDEIERLGDMAGRSVRKVSGASRRNAQRLVELAREAQSRRRNLQTVS